MLQTTFVDPDCCFCSNASFHAFFTWLDTCENLFVFISVYKLDFLYSLISLYSCTTGFFWIFFLTLDWCHLSSLLHFACDIWRHKCIFNVRCAFYKGRLCSNWTAVLAAEGWFGLVDMKVKTSILIYSGVSQTTSIGCGLLEVSKGF